MMKIGKSQIKVTASENSTLTVSHRDGSDATRTEANLAVFGFDDNDAFNVLLNQIINVKPSHQTLQDHSNYVLSMLVELKPRDAMEAMLITQMVAAHTLAMEMNKRALLPEQTVEGVDTNINRATKLQRTFVQQMEALQKYRNQGKQTIQVQHVNIEAGGQAVVGNITGGEG